jgi:hypothetical protein
VGAITAADVQTRRDALMALGRSLSVIVAIPTATDDTTPGVYLVKDPAPGDAPNTAATEPGNAKGGNATGDGQSWKQYSYSAVGTAYNL